MPITSNCDEFEFTVKPIYRRYYEIDRDVPDPDDRRMCGSANLTWSHLADALAGERENVTKAFQALEEALGFLRGLEVLVERFAPLMRNEPTLTVGEATKRLENETAATATLESVTTPA